MYNLAEQEQKDVFICSAIVWDCRGQSPTKKVADAPLSPTGCFHSDSGERTNSNKNEQ